MLPVSADTLEQLQAALRTTISQPYGTGFYVYQGSVLRVAGKSGTSEDQILDPESLEDLEQDAAGEAQQQQEIEVELNSDDSGSDQAQQEDEEEDDQSFNNVWFAGWANFEEPRLVVAVVLDSARSGSDDAGPVVRRVLEGAILNNWVP